MDEKDANEPEPEADENRIRRGLLVWLLAMSVLSPLLVGVAGIVYTSHVQRQADRRWCALLSSLDSPQAPATTDRGRVVQQQMHELRTDLGCDR